MRWTLPTPLLVATYIFSVEAASQSLLRRRRNLVQIQDAAVETEDAAATEDASFWNRFLRDDASMSMPPPPPPPTAPPPTNPPPTAPPPTAPPPTNPPPTNPPPTNPPPTAPPPTNPPPTEPLCDVPPDGCTLEVEETEGTWAEHDQLARDVGCNLASILSSQEQEALITAVNSNSVALDAGRVYLGGSNVGTLGQAGPDNWEWTDGSAWCYEAFQDGEPNNFNGVGESVLSLRFLRNGNRVWNDIVGMVRLPAVYKCCGPRLPPPTPPPPTNPPPTNPPPTNPPPTAPPPTNPPPTMAAPTIVFTPVPVAATPRPINPASPVPPFPAPIPGTPAPIGFATPRPVSPLSPVPPLPPTPGAAVCTAPIPTDCRYQVSDTTGTVAQHTTLAAAQGCELASILSEQEHQAAIQTVNSNLSTQDKIYLGASVVSGMTWEWTDGNVWCYENWMDGSAPANAGSDTALALMSTDDDDDLLLWTNVAPDANYPALYKCCGPPPTAPPPTNPPPTNPPPTNPPPTNPPPTNPPPTNPPPTNPPPTNPPPTNPPPTNPPPTNPPPTNPPPTNPPPTNPPPTMAAPTIVFTPVPVAATPRPINPASPVPPFPAPVPGTPAPIGFATPRPVSPLSPVPPLPPTPPTPVAPVPAPTIAGGVCAAPPSGCVMQVSETSQTFAEHQAVATGQGCNLASVLSEQEHQAVIQAVNSVAATQSAETVYLGGRIRQGGTQGQPGPENWEWIDGEPWCYENFHPTEPNNEFGNETVLTLFILDQARLWNDEEDALAAPAVYKCCGGAGGGGVQSSMLQYVIQTDNLNTLETAVTSANLGTTFSGTGQNTLFAPTNAAFAAVDQAFLTKVLEPEWVLHLRALLATHVHPNVELFAADLSDGLVISTLSGDDLTANLNGQTVSLATSVNSGIVVQADVDVSNGVVHQIDTVLVPTLFSTDLVTVGEASGFTTLSALIAQAGLEETLRDQSKGYTIIAPSDAALAALPQATMDRLNSDNDFLQSVLLYHVLPGLYPAETLTDGQVITTALDGQTVTVSVVNGAVSFNGLGVENGDLLASNGIIHGVGGVLIPGDLPCPAKPAGCSLQVATVTMTWGDHKTAAEAQGCQLASVLDQAEHDAMVAALGAIPSTQDAQTVYLGGQIKAGGTQGMAGSDNWEWLDGQPWCYENFHPDEPNNEFGNETILSLFILGDNRLWNDEENALLAPAVYKCCNTGLSVIRGQSDLSTFSSVITGAQLEGVFTGSGPLTLLAPSDTAFGTVDQGLLTQLQEPSYVVHLRRVLQMHYTNAGSLKAADLTDGQVIEVAADGESLTTSVVNGTVTFSTASNNATVTEADFLSSNGIIHKIDAVLLPNFLTLNLVDVATAAGYSEFAALVTTAGLDSVLTNTDSAYTVFAPTNAAINGLDQSVKDQFSDTAFLASVMNNHIVPGVFPYEQFSNGQTLTTSSAGTLGVVVDGFLIIIDGVSIANADLVASNGLVHGIGGVLIPGGTGGGTGGNGGIGGSVGGGGTVVCTIPSKSCTFNVSEELLTWEEHQAAAKAMDCNLASILTPDEHATALSAVDAVASTTAATTVYIGGQLRDDGTAGQSGGENWEWIDDNQWCYENFHAGEPNDEHGNGNETVISLLLLDDQRLWNDEENHGMEPALYKCCGPSAQTVVGGQTSLSTFGSVASTAGLSGALTSNAATTWFAPSNDAFSAVDSAYLDQLSTAEYGAHLRYLLNFHSISAGVASGGLSDGMSVETSVGESVTVSVVNGTASLVGPSNNVTIVTTDLETNNGYVHILDGVLMPAALKQNLVEVATGNGYSTLVSLVAAAGLDSLLADNSTTFTVLVPTEAALTAAAGALTNTTVRDATLKFHVLPGLYPSSSLTTGQTIATALDGKSVTVNVTDDAVTFNGVTVEQSDIVASNGLIHVVSGVVPSAEETGGDDMGGDHGSAPGNDDRLRN